jgi:hypothetical protein
MVELMGWDEFVKYHGELREALGGEWVQAVGPGGQPERPAWIPRCSSFAVTAGLSGGAVSWQLQVRLLNGLGPALAGPVSALAGAAATTQEPRTIAALISES